MDAFLSKPFTEEELREFLDQQIIDDAEDPQKMLDQLVRDYTNNIADAESAIAETIGNLRLLERAAAR